MIEVRLRFQVLGDVRVSVDGRPVVIRQQRLLSLLAVLLADVNTTIPMDTLVDRVWGELLPSAPRPTLHTYVSRLRTALAAGEDASIVRQSGGYLLTADPETVDLHRFRRRYAEARTAESDDEAAALLSDALGEWQAEAFTGADSPWLTDLRETLARERLAAQVRYHDIQLRRGMHGEIIAGLTELTVSHPLDERLAAQLISALDAAGRRADAFAHYQRVRQALVDQLGVDPGPQLREAHQRVLTDTPSAPDNPVPRQLPADIPGFTGRQEYLHRLDGLLRAPGDGPMIISSVSGMAGIGKTTLVVHWAHEVAHHFPDGQLYVNLRGFDASGSVMRPAEAVRGFLDALGVAPQQVPSGLEAQIGLFRSLLAERRVLVVLDNARDAEQVRPLLPGSASCLVVVTSRNQLAGLVATNNARPVTLDLLDEAEAEQLLLERLGAQRVSAEPEAVAEIIALCARLPLALVVVAARAAIRPEFPLSAVAEQLQESGDPSTDLHSVFSWSVQALSPAAAGAFGSLGVHPDTDFSLAAAASMIGTTPAAARRLLRELCDAYLLTEHLPGRYTFHDLLRAYARTCTTDGEDALHRILDHYVHTGDRAAMLFYPHRTQIELVVPLTGVIVTGPADLSEAVAWFTAEERALVAAVRLAYDHGLDVHCWQLALAMANLQDRRGQWVEQLDVLKLGLAAAERLDDNYVRVRMYRNAATASYRLGRREDTYTYLDAALRTAERKTDKAPTHLTYASALLRHGQPAEALRHAHLALEIHVELGERHGEAETSNAIGWCHAQLGNYQEALTWCEKALATHIELGGRISEADTLDSLGFAHHHLGHHAKAIECYERALVIDKENGDITKQAEVLEHLGDVQLAIGDTARARLAWEEAVAIWMVTRSPGGEPVRTKLNALLTSLEPDKFGDSGQTGHCG
jgi:DNA-binding SARP family transcriptional activator